MTEAKMPETGVGKVVDPTKNVLDLVEAAIRRQDDLREMESRYQNDMRAAETRRVNELAEQKQLFDLETSRVLRLSAEDKSMLLAAQLKEVKTDLQTEIKGLNQFRWETGGRGAGMAAFLGWIVAAVVIAGFFASNFMGKVP
jgi:hypothetical protein